MEYQNFETILKEYSCHIAGYFCSLEFVLLQAADIEKFADAVVIGTLDHLHKDPCIAFANRGYHILLEKPIAPTLEECEEITNVCKRNEIIFAVGHVLRYTPHNLKVKEILESGRIGKEF